MKKVFLFSAAVALMTTSCVWKSELETAQYQRDSIQTEKDQVEDEMNSYLEMIQEVQANFNSIKSTELGIIEQTSATEGVNPNTKDQLQNDFQTITEALRSNKEKIAQLDSALQKANGTAAYFRGLVGGLQKQLKDSEAKLQEFQTKLKEKDIKIACLDSTIMTMNARQDSINQVNAQQLAAIQAQDTELNTAYYFIGDKTAIKEKGLKAKLLTSASINTSYFTSVDIREFNELDLGSKKAFVLSSHPINSYTIAPKSADDKTLVLKITNYSAFWSNTHKLIIQVK